jgi:hypothetical protein
MLNESVGILENQLGKKSVFLIDEAGLVGSRQAEKLLNESVEIWENRLDNLGHLAPLPELLRHLAIAPESAPTKQLLSDFLQARTA